MQRNAVCLKCLAATFSGEERGIDESTAQLEENWNEPSCWRSLSAPGPGPHRASLPPSGSEDLSPYRTSSQPKLRSSSVRPHLSMGLLFGGDKLTDSPAWCRGPLLHGTPFGCSGRPRDDVRHSSLPPLSPGSQSYLTLHSQSTHYHLLCSTAPSLSLYDFCIKEREKGISALTHLRTVSVTGSRGH
ncbi:hypothetical protein DPEC_G00242810 [Dallia pectoralis]|uniref:Uncharacterized protein n=1 Tax=Dallia pectoralis TaxID=75939 RepID=A0ACC2FVC8_DALPE|nr:hypothetical protein DPEC_G00242810 [Dallia pectoralis]